MMWMYQGKSTFVTGSVPPDDNTTQDDNYRSNSSDNKSSDTAQEMSSLKKKSSQDVSTVFVCVLFLIFLNCSRRNKTAV